ncbi:hypothetical protein DFH11DRAFT_706213 [Phellopilus nigrolimitatus]|nr:hypothetical protein DFH11DRAFT_706213 [Phellopilus nigrolimitatus]
MVRWAMYTAFLCSSHSYMPQAVCARLVTSYHVADAPWWMVAGLSLHGAGSMALGTQAVCVKLVTSYRLADTPWWMASRLSSRGAGSRVVGTHDH